MFLLPLLIYALWKEKFIAGLPPNFAEKVREKLAQLYPSLPLKEITYGRISSAIKMTGLEICSNMKIEQQIKRNSEKGIRELGNFCLQYGYEKPIPPSAQHKKLIKRRKAFNKKNNKPFRKPFRKQNTSKSKPFNNNKNIHSE